MAGNGKKQTDLFNPNYKRYDLTQKENWEGDYPDGDFGNNIQKLYEVPDIADMAGVFLRGVFKNERSLNAHLRLMYRHRKFGDIEHQELLRAKIAGSAAIAGLSRLDAVQAAVNVLAPDLYRIARGLPKAKKDEQDRVIRGSDFSRKEERPPDGGMGAQR